MSPGPRKVYIYPADSYLGRSLGPALQARGYEVLGGHFADACPSYLHASYKIGSASEAAAKKQFLAIADAVIHEIQGHEQAARDAVVHLTRQPFGGRQQIYIGVSNPLVWAATRPPAPLPQDDLLDIPDSASVLAGDTASLLAGRPSSQRPSSAAPTETGGEGGAAAKASAGAADPGGEGGEAGVKPPSPPDPYIVAATVGALTERDMAQRAPCLSARNVHELEQLVLRSQRKGRLRTLVVCPGLMYGQGEDDGVLHPLMRAAWEVSAPLTIYATGSNYLPMVHVDDCAAYLAALAAPEVSLAGMPDTQQYLLLTDCAGPGLPGGVTQCELATALSKHLGVGETITIPAEQLLFERGVERWTLDVRMATTPLPAAAEYMPAYTQGFMANIDKVIEQWLRVRGVTPLRILLSGPPMAGKSTAAARLAAAYNLPHYTVKDLLAASSMLSPEEAKALASEITGKEPRASQRSLSLLMRALLSASKANANRGYILDGWPKTAAGAKWAFMKVEPMTPEELAEKQQEEEYARTMTASKTTKDGKGSKPAAAAPKKDAKGGKGSGGDGPEVLAGHKLVPDLAFAPTHLIELSASPEELRGRMKAVEASEIEAARAVPSTDAATAASKDGKAPAKGGKEKLPTLSSHNNEKDFARRCDAWAKLKAEESDDLAAKVAAAEDYWAIKQEQAAEARARAEAEANTLRAKRRRAKEAAAAAAAAAEAAGAGSSAGHGVQGVMDGSGNARAGVGVGDAGLAAGAAAASASPDVSPVRGAASAAPAVLPTLARGMLPNSPARTDNTPPDAAVTSGLVSAAPEGPVLPKLGGLAGVVVEGCGAKHVLLENPDRPEGPPEPTMAEAWRELRLPELEAALRTALGQPRNFEGFPLEPLPAAVDQPASPKQKASMSAASVGSARVLGSAGGAGLGPSQGVEAGSRGVSRVGNGGQRSGQEPLRTASIDDGADMLQLLLPQTQEASAQAAASHALKEAYIGEPVRQFLMAAVMPAVCEALRVVARDRPPQPLRVLGQHLIAEAEKWEANYVDPYSDQSYELQVAKHEAKKERDRARDVAAAQKLEREMAVKQAARLAERDAATLDGEDRT